jgi:hypothetical protein
MTPAQYRDALTRLNLTQVAAARLLGIDDRTGVASLRMRRHEAALVGSTIVQI